jgi:H/ACA ribonucleoprotein complex subunit 2
MAADDNVDIVDKKLKKEKKSKDKSEKKDKKDKKDKKRSENDGIHKEKKDKKKEKAKQEKLARVLDAHLQADAAKSEVKDEDIKVEDQKIKAKNQDIKVTDLDIKDEKKIKIDPEDLIKPAEELVPFALPLADEKTHKKIYKLIKKGTAASPNFSTCSQARAN